eukprot:537372_1
MNKRNMILCTICFFPILGCYLFAAIIIAYVNTCNNYDSYNFIDPNLYLKIGGFGFLSTSILTIITRFTIFESTDYNNYETTTKEQACILCVAILLESIWGLIGCVVYSEISINCQESSIGKMVLSFIIITFVFNACNYISLAQGCTEQQQPHEYNRLPPV